MATKKKTVQRTRREQIYTKEETVVFLKEIQAGLSSSRWPWYKANSERLGRSFVKHFPPLTKRKVNDTTNKQLAGTLRIMARVLTLQLKEESVGLPAWTNAALQNNLLVLEGAATRLEELSRFSHA